MSSYKYKGEEYKVIIHEKGLDIEELGQTAIHRVKVKNSHIDLLIKEFDSLSPSSSVLVGFTAATDDWEKTTPFFSGLGISNTLNVPLIAIADPTVTSYSTGLAWYAGNQELPNLQYEICKIIQDIYSTLNFSHYVFFGGSGGGFACLAQLMLIKKVPIKCFVFNPQTLITNYKWKSVHKYASLAFSTQYSKMECTKESVQELLNNNGIIHTIDAKYIDEKTELIYFQNRSDWHVVSHLEPFINMSKSRWTRLGNCSFYNGSNHMLYVGDWGDGHAKPPIELILYVLESFVNGISSLEIIKKMEDRLIAFDEIGSFYSNQTLLTEVDFDVIMAKNQCRIKINCPSLKYNSEVQYAIFLIEGNKTVLARRSYMRERYCTFDISNYNTEKLSVKVFIKMPDGSKTTIRKRIL